MQDVFQANAALDSQGSNIRFGPDPDASHDNANPKTKCFVVSLYASPEAGIRGPGNFLRRDCPLREAFRNLEGFFNDSERPG
jgi:hypothetical protein